MNGVADFEENTAEWQRTCMGGPFGWKLSAALFIATVLFCLFAPARGETMVASFYGAESGHRTASGETFHPGGMTAAHRTLPFGTRLRVCRGERCVHVRINDRGPFVRGRQLDLAAGAARAIGLPGVGRVEVTRE